jgi:hypothetical protein
MTAKTPSTPWFLTVAIQSHSREQHPGNIPANYAPCAEPRHFRPSGTTWATLGRRELTWQKFAQVTLPPFSGAEVRVGWSFRVFDTSDQTPLPVAAVRSSLTAACAEPPYTLDAQGHKRYKVECLSR